MPDARVQAAVDHWAPRFVQAGVDYNDFVATTARVESWVRNYPRLFGHFRDSDGRTPRSL